MTTPAAPGDYRKESYQQVMGLTLAQASVEVSCKMMRALYNRGVLDLCERDDQGRNVIDRFCEHAPLSKHMLEEIDLLGGRQAWSRPHKGHFVAMDNHINWIKRGTNQSTSHSTHRPSTNKISEVAAVMVAQVDSAWLGLDQDRGAGVVGKLIDCGPDSLACLQAAWDRGADIHARTDNGDLAVARLPSFNFVQAWMARGGDLQAPVNTSGDLPMWRHIAAHLQTSCSAGYTPVTTINNTFRGLVDEKLLREECLFLEAWSEKTNQSSMIKHLVSIENWHEARRPDGTPVWLAALQARPELLENFLTRKRARPDFTQRDSSGRSAWYAMTGLPLGLMKRAAPLLEKELPMRDYGRSTQGQGLFVQVLEEAGGLPALVYAKTPLAQQVGLKNAFALLETEDDQGKMALLDGLDDLDFRQLDVIPKDAAQTVAARLFTSHALVAHMMPATAMQVGLWALSLQLRDENNLVMTFGGIAPIIDNLKWVIATHGPHYPDEMQQWAQDTWKWDRFTINGLREDDVNQVKSELQAMIGQALLDARVPTAGREAAGPKARRF